MTYNRSLITSLATAGSHRDEYNAGIIFESYTHYYSYYLKSIWKLYAAFLFIIGHEVGMYIMNASIASDPSNDPCLFPLLLLPGTPPHPYFTFIFLEKIFKLVSSYFFT